MPLWRPGKAKAAARSSDRLPPGQHLVKGWPVLHEGSPPPFDAHTWRLRVWGKVGTPLSLRWEELMALPQTEVVADFHCVTSWSRYDNRWSGVRVRDVLDQAGVWPEASHALVYSYDAVGYTTNLTFEDLARPDNLIATHHDGQPLSPEHGGPARLVVHHLYAWKSCKWLGGIELLAADRRGYWEERGYHNRGDPWADERYSYQEEEST